MSITLETKVARRQAAAEPSSAPHPEATAEGGGVESDSDGEKPLRD